MASRQVIGRYYATRNTDALEAMQKHMDALVQPSKRPKITLDKLKRGANGRPIAKAT